MGGKESNKIDVDVTSHRMQIIRWIGMIIPLLLVTYSLFMQFSPLGNPQPLTETFVVVLSCWVALALWEFFIPPKTKTHYIVGLVLYHILAFIYVVTVSGFDMPLIYTWSALLLASSIYYGQSGVSLSIVTLFTAASVSVIINAEDDKKVVSIVLHFLGTVILSYLIKLVLSAQAVDQQELLVTKESERIQHDRLLTIVNNLSDAIISTDKTGKITLYNAAALNLLDTNQNITGRKLDTLLSATDKDKKAFRFSTKLHHAKSTQYRDDLTATISGESIRISATYTPIRNVDSDKSEQADGYVIILRDITREKSLEDERDEFISVVSHELRTPITVAEGSLGNVSVMIERPDIPKEKLVDSVKLAHEQIIFLARMVNDLSTLSRAERGVADAPEEIDIKTLIHDLYNEYSPQAAARSLSFDIEIDPTVGSVSASRLYLKEILQNFITNAIKYTESGGVVVSAKTEADNSIRFSVKDTGIGISRSDQMHIYQKFWRSEDYRTRETSGTGLGLYVVTKLAKKLNTTIDLKSRLNHGSTFSFRLKRPEDNKT